MPHQCIECGRTFPDGSKEMLSGCPDCGGNKFQFQPSSATTTPSETPTERTDPDPSGPDHSSVETTSRTASDVTPEDGSDSDLTAGSRVRSDADPPVDATAADSKREASTAADSEREDPMTDDLSSEPDDASTTADDVTDTDTGSQRVNDDGTENAAQASARSDVVSRDELDRVRQDVPTSERPDSEDSERPRPDVDELRNELNEQFESIRIVSPGQYELNLMELYDRQEYIISLQEDGRYVIEMPDAWGIED